MTPSRELKLGGFRLNDVNQAEAIAALTRLPEESVDLIVTDPPYNLAKPGRSTRVQGRVVSTMKAWGSWDRHHPFDYDLLILRLISESWRTLKPGGALYLFTATQHAGYFARKAEERGFEYRTQLALVKKNPLPSCSKRAWRSGHEVCLYLTKGKPKTFNFLSQKELVNVYAHWSLNKETRHPTEKPLEMIERIVRVSSNPEEIVIDPFVGSGTTAVAAKKWSRRFLGFDLSEEYLAMARDRVARTAAIEPIDHRSECSKK